MLQFKFSLSAGPPLPVLTVHAVGDPTAFVELSPRFAGARCRFLPQYQPAPLASRVPPR
ncbi:MAG: hypothetical protein U1E90_02005 [Burkholderiaceae bacterium]